MPKAILITGAGRGIGAAIAKRGAKDGYDVLINFSHDRQRAEETAEICRQFGSKAEIFQADIGKEDEIKALFEFCDHCFGRLDGLVNNAGIIGKAACVSELDSTTLRQVIDVNFIGAYLASQQALRRMLPAHGGNGGAIVNISSIAATLGSPGEYVHYAASKAALDGFTIGLAREVGPQGVRVNSVQAGTVDTEIHYRDGNPKRPAMVAETAPLRRCGTPEDIAEAVLYLLSDKASYTTGAILRVGGGL